MARLARHAVLFVFCLLTSANCVRAQSLTVDENDGTFAREDREPMQFAAMTHGYRWYADGQVDYDP